VTESTSYADLGAVLDGLLATYPDLPELSCTTIELRHGGRITAHTAAYDGVLEWARALSTSPNIYGSAPRVQAEVDITVDGVRVLILRSRECDLGEVAHEHETCLEQARAAAGLARELVQA
jgi:hypothetical protein